MKNNYKSILVIQSYPTLTYVTNNLANLPKPVLILCMFNQRIYKFIKQIKLEGVHVQAIGYGPILRKSALAFLRPYYVSQIGNICRKLRTDNLILTFNNYADMSALPIFYVKYKKVSIWVPYEEKRYLYKKHDEQYLLNFQNKIVDLTSGLIERKYFKGRTVRGDGTCVGLNPNHELIAGADWLYLPQITNVDKLITKAVSPCFPFVILVERELLKSGHISITNYIKLLLKIKKICNESNYTLYVKFKPRHLYLTKYVMFRLLGIKILPTSVPAQFYCASENCRIILGFTSSTLSIDYGIPFLCLASLKRTFKKSLSGNIASMKDRMSDGKIKVRFIKEIDEIIEVMSS